MMFMIAKITSKWKITIPNSIRLPLGIDDGDHVAIVIENGNATLQRADIQISKEKGT